MANELHIACINGDLEQVKALIANDASLINQPHTRWNTYPIFFAAQKGHLHIVQYLLTLPLVKTASTHSSWDNLLIYSCSCDIFEKREELLQFIHNHAERCQFEDQLTKLHIAAARGDYEYCNAHNDKLLLFYHDNFPPIFYSLLMNQQKIVELIFTDENNIKEFILSILKSQKLASLVKFFQVLQIKEMRENKYFSCIKLAITAYLNESEQVSQNCSTQNPEFADNEYRRLLILYLLAVKILLYDNKYSEAVSTYNQALVFQEKIKDKTVEDYNMFDIVHRNIANSYIKYGSIQYNDKKYIEAVSTYNQALVFQEKIKDKTVEDYNMFDIVHTNIANSYIKYGSIQYNDKKYIEAVSAFKQAIAELELVKNISSEDRSKLDNLYRNIAFSFAQHGNRLFTSKQYLEAVSAYKQAIVEKELVNVKNNHDKVELDVYHRNLYQSYLEHGRTIFKDKMFLEGKYFLEEAKASLDIIKNKTRLDENNLDEIYIGIALALELQGINLYNDKKYPEAAIAFKEAINNRNSMKVKLDDCYNKKAKNFLYLARIYSSLQAIPDSDELIKYLQNAINELSKVRIYSERSCTLIREIYQMWKSHSRPNSCEWYFADVALHLFSTIQINRVLVFETLFPHLYNEIKNASWQSQTSSLRSSLILFMELLLKCSENNTLNASNQLYGVQYLLASKANKELFIEKLNELRSIPGVTLTSNLEHHQSTAIAILTKMNAMEKDIQQLKEENAKLKSALQLAVPHLAPPVTIPLIESTTGVDNNSAPATASAQTALDIPASTIGPVIVIPALSDNVNSIWQHKRPRSEDDKADKIPLQSNDSAAGQPEDELTKQVSKKRSVLDQ